MNLLPKAREEFKDKSYWDNFFKNRGNKAFEWYGEYPELSEHLHKYVKPKDNILIVGCGNSTLGNDLYDIGHKNITSIDISQVAIRQMNNLNQKNRPDMKFIQMDALQMSFEDDQFSAIIDKGTLDALMPDDNTETLKQVEKYFSEILRVLKIGGRYVCISLLQEHILKYVTHYFPDKQCMFRVTRCYEAEKTASEAGESSLPVFIIICTKFKALPMKVLELNLSASDKMQRIGSENELIEQVKSIQDAAFICSGLKRTSIADSNDVSLDLYLPGGKLPRYTIYIVDIKPERKHMPYAAFIVPQGRENEWLFATKDGRKELTKISKANRLSVVILHRNEIYESFDVVKTELQESIRNLAPPTLGKEKIPFISLGSDVGSRKICYEGNSKYSGDYVIEDVLVDDVKYRRLFYLSSQFVIQSEAKLKTTSRNGKAKEITDLSYLTCEHHIYMTRGLHMAVDKKSNTQALVIGLGGGGLCSFLRKFTPDVHIVAIDIDEDMLKIAKDWFGLNLDEKLKVEIEDGIKYIEKSAIDKVQYDCVLFDVDSKDSNVGMSCPPKEFLDNKVLDNVKNILKDSGLFILNAVLRDFSLRKDVIQKLSTKFSTIASYKLDKDLNEVFLCSKNKLDKNSFNNLFDDASKSLNRFFRTCKNNDLINENDCKHLIYNE